MIRVDLHDRADAFQGTLTGARLAAYHVVLNQEGAASFQIHRADKDAVPQTTTATNTASAAQAHVTFTVAPTGFVNGQKIVVDYGAALEEDAVILSGAGTTDWTLAENLVHTHAAGYEVYSGPLRGKWDGALVHLLRKGPLDTIFVERFVFRVEDVTLDVGDQEEAGAWLNVSGRGTLSLLEDRIVYPPGFDGALASSIVDQWQIYTETPGGSIMAGEIDRSNPRFGLQLTHSLDSGTPFASPVAADNPTAWYRLDDVPASSTAVDLGSGAHNGTIHGGVTRQVPGALSPDPDTAMSFDGTTGYIQAGLPQVVVNNWTIGARVKPMVFKGSGFASVYQVGTYGSDGYGFGIGNSIYDGGTHLCCVFHGIATYDSGYAFPDVNRWYDVKVTYDHANLRFYVDSILVATIPAAGAPNVPTGSSWIGSDSIPGSFFNGAIDEPAAFSTTLSAARVQVQYAAGSSFYLPVSLTSVLQTVKLRFDNLRKLHDFLVSNGMDAQMVGLDYQASDHLGVDRSATVRLRLSSKDSLLGLQVERSSRPIKNFVVVQGTGEGINSKLATSSNALSISAYDRREGFIDDSQVDDQTQLGLEATSAVSQLKDPDQRITVPFVDSAVTRIYQHFALGDAVMLDNAVMQWVAPYRVVGITVADTQNDIEQIFLDLNSMRQEYLMRLATGQQVSADSLNVIARMPQGSIFNDSKAYMNECGPGFPFHLYLFLPSNLLKLNYAKLSFKLGAYRTYNSFSSSSSGAETGHSHGHTHSSASHSHHNTAVTTGYNSAYALSSASALEVATGPAPGWNMDSTTPGSTGSDSSGSSGHTHPLSITSILGITESTSATGVTVLINGVDHTVALGGGPGFTADQTELEISQWLVVGQWNTIDLTSTVLGRIYGDLRVTGYIQSN